MTFIPVTRFTITLGPHGNMNKAPHLIYAENVHNYNESDGIFSDSGRGTVRVGTRRYVEIVRSELAQQYPLPKMHTNGSIGFDLHAERDFGVLSHEHAKIPTGIRIGCPWDVWFTVHPRSSLFQRGLLMPVGTVDSDYRGDMFAAVYNMTNYPIKISAGERICQIVFHERPPTVQWLEIDQEHMSITDRGESGFGSTGD